LKTAQLNYDPTDADKMRLPVGTTCGSCVHIRRCSMIFGHTETDTYCDWVPSRYQANPNHQKAQTLAAFDALESADRRVRVDATNEVRVAARSVL